MILLESISHNAIDPAMAVLPPAMDCPRSRVLLLAIGLQESRFMYRAQKIVGQPYVKGPARGFWQFELGSQAKGGGVWGVYQHEASRYWLAKLCDARRIPFKAEDIWRTIETDDVLAAGLARLLLFTDPRVLPSVDDVEGAWGLYAYRTWRPGRPHRDTWNDFHKSARGQVVGVAL